MTIEQRRLHARRIIGHGRNGPIYAIAGGAPDADVAERPQAPTLTHSQAINRLREITSELERLAELEDPSPDDESYFRELTDEFSQVDKHRKRLERDAELARVKSAGEGINARNLRTERGSQAAGDGYDRDAILEPDSIEDRRFRDPWDLSEVRTFGRDRGQVAAELRARALDAIAKMPAANDSIRQAGTQILERWDNEHSYIARLVLTTSSPAYLRAWSRKARDPQSADFTAEERVAWQAAEQFRAMSLTDSAGGYLVPFQLDPTVIVTSAGSLNEIRQVARQVVATGDIWNGVSSGAVSWSWDAEGAEVSDDATTFAQPTVAIHKAAGFVPISIEALQDEANVTATVAELLAEGREDLEAVAFATGTGSGQPFGIITALTGGGSVVASATTDVFAIADVYNVHGALPARHRTRASWLANILIYNRIRQFDTAGGAGLWARISEGEPEALLGRRSLEAEAMDGSITALADNLVLLFGNFSNYVIADRIGMTVEFIPHLFHTTTNRPSGQRGWYAYYRCGADSVHDGAFRLLNVT